MANRLMDSAKQALVQTRCIVLALQDTFKLFAELQLKWLGRANASTMVY